MDYISYFELGINNTHIMAGLFMLVLTAFGVCLSLKLKRPKLFKFKLMFVYILPFIISVTYLIPNHTLISHSYRILLICTFIALFQVLYFREVKSEITDIGKYKTYFPDFLDIVPDMVWMKDLDNRFTYTNEAIRTGLLKCSEEEAFGKTGMELADIQKEKGHEYTFGDICLDTDEETLEKGKACRFLELGTVNGKFIALQVFKSPVFITDHEGNKRLTGTIGMGRDLTYDFADHEKITQLIDDGVLEEVKIAFDEHKRRYMFTGISVKMDDSPKKSKYSRRWYDNSHHGI